MRCEGLALLKFREPIERLLSLMRYAFTLWFVDREISFDLFDVFSRPQKKMRVTAEDVFIFAALLEFTRLTNTPNFQAKPEGRLSRLSLM